MTYFGVLCPSTPGHLNPMMCLGRELQRRGHGVTFFQILDVEQKVLREGLDFYPIGQSDAPLGSLEQTLAELGKRTGAKASEYTFELIKREAKMVCEEVPSAIRTKGIEVLLVDQLEIAGGSIADYLGIPFLTVCNATVQNREADVPPNFVPWDYQEAWWARLRNKLWYRLMDSAFGQTYNLVNEYRRQWNLPPHQIFDDFFSQLAQISQQPAEFEFPRKHLPRCFHFTGPYHDLASREPVFFPFEKLTKRALIYASMGTLQNRQQEIFRCIAEACAELDVQLVISLGGGSKPESLQELLGDPLVVEYAPQLELLQRTTLTITHAGMNTTLESLSNGVPMVAIPITNDQPGVAARIAWTGTGEVVPLSRLGVPKLRAAMQRVLTEDSYRENASRLQQVIQRADGVSRAADIVEQVALTGTPAYR